jgi:hypothetical protein
MQDEPMIICGYTGSKFGMTSFQQQTLNWVLSNQAGAADEQPKFHHGDCIGGDEQAAKIAKALGFWTIGHPPTDPKLRAFFPSDEERDPLPYLQRDRALVKEVPMLVATPHGPEIRRSGTWATIRYAREAGVPRLIIRPNGTYHLDTDNAA